MAALKISVVEFRDLITLGGRGWPTWSAKAPEHDPHSGKTSCREVVDERGVTAALFFTYSAGAVVQEVEVPASNIRSICRLPVPEEQPVAKAPLPPGAKAGAK